NLNDKIRKATTHISQNEALIFEKSSPGKKAYKLPLLDVPEVDPAELLGDHARQDLGEMPEVSEIEIIRHYTRLSTWNYAVDHGMYPLGSCTMKYNARVNEYVARLMGLAEAHPYQPERISQGALRILKMLSEQLIEITGMDAITLQPAAGAHGELTGILMVRAYLESRGNPRKKILIPDSAHGTNPATAAMAGYTVENLKSNAAGMVDLAALEAQVNQDVAALMLTNPNTLGVFEQEIHKIAEVLHAKGALLYMDGANMNALVGKVRPGDFGADVMHLNLHKTFSTPHGGGGPGSGPVACKKLLEPFLPSPVIITKPDGTLGFDYNRPKSIGRVRMFYGNFGMHVRALAYIMANGPDGLRQTTEDAVLNANYIRKKLEGYYDLPYSTPTMHEVVFSDRVQTSKGLKTGDIAKRLIDYGFHPYTVSFPLVVHGALMIEPTESESKEELDQFIDAMKAIAEEAEREPKIIATAPHNTRISRLDEVTAARKPVLHWRPQCQAAGK
ncbi:MAG TPA: aminomethyl-transferring glycine dehydrogenase subunit GcvPB, partial [Terriglobales bacterium]|nr:aminomethyl-transferring glycine dehydrogenase subunit GcvPB [Terriglobales bacterium]